MFVDTKEIAFLQDLSKPSLRALSYLLRHKELWPKGFTWNFNNCSYCAMGLAGELWGLVDESKLYNHAFDEIDLRWQSI